MASASDRRQAPQYTGGTGFAQHHHALKASRVAVIGIGHLGVRTLARKVQEQMQLVRMLWRALLLQMGQVVAVHCQQQVKPLKVVRAHSASALTVNLLITSGGGYHHRPEIGLLTLMAHIGPCRIHFDPIRQTTLFQLGLQGTGSQRRAASGERQMLPMQMTRIRIMA